MAGGPQEEAEAHKLRGNELLKAGKVAEAAEAYGLAIQADPENAVYWSNRSAARLKAGNKAGALEDAEETVRRKPGWTKGYHRKATALQALDRPREGAAACTDGLGAAEGGTQEGELKELRRLHKVLMNSAGSLLLQGWWHGKVSEPLGGFEQEFHIKSDNLLECVVYGNALPGSHKVDEVEDSQHGGLRGGIDISLDSTRVPYLFRVGDGDGLLHLCCPMKSPNERPRTFDGPGYVAMRPGRLSEEGTQPLAQLSEPQRLLQYLTELADIMESRPSAGGGSGGEAAERLEDSGGGTVTSSQVFGEESLEDRAKKMAADQKMAALRIKYSGEIEDAAQKLISGEAKADDFKPGPEEARDLERVLRRFGGRRKAKDGAAGGQAPALAAASPPAPAEAPAPAPATAPATAEAGQPPPPAADAPAAGGGAAGAAAKGAAATAPRPPTGSCWQACFAGFGRRKQ